MTSFKILTSDKEEEIVVRPTIQPINHNEESVDVHKFVQAHDTSSLYLQSSPMLFSSNGHSMWFGDMYRGSTAFLILGGPSFKTILDSPNINLLNKPGFVTASVNNAISSFRTDLWISNDHPHQFIKSAWLDPKVMKFAPLERMDDKIFDSGDWKFMDKCPRDCPNVWYFKRNKLFNPETFMYEDSFNWGNDKQFGGKRSVMLIAMKMLYYLGIRKVFLLGCDFNMSADSTYHFKQERHDSSISGNNKTYEEMQHRFEQLKPIFDQLGYQVFNCNPDSNLKAFPFVSFEDAIASVDFPDVITERTDGLYDREYRLREEAKKK